MPQNQQPKTPKSVYVHIPFCKAKCFYCGFFSKPADKYNIEKVLSAEIAELKKAGIQKDIETLYIGGGSPASVGGEALCEFLQKIITYTGRPEEFTVEINPNDADEKLFANLKNIGVNRISIGAQSFIQSELDFLGRKYTPDKIFQTIQAAKNAGFKNISIDLIFAIPNSNMESWRENLETAGKLDVQHISAYSLTYEKNTPLEKFKLSGNLNVVDEETDRQMYETAIEMLSAYGFEHYEISNFAKAGFKCRHNLAYWKNDEYVGIGPAAASYVGNFRFENVSDIDKYVELIEQNKDAADEKLFITADEKAAQTAVLNLRLTEGINLAEYEQKTGFALYDLFKKPIEKHIKSNLLELNGGYLKLTKTALPLADFVLCDFAAL